jgi:hypothetical protein
MSRNTSSYGGDGTLTTTMDREPIDIGRRPEFWGDFLKTRQFVTPKTPAVVPPLPGVGCCDPYSGGVVRAEGHERAGEMLAAPCRSTRCTCRRRIRR